MCGKSGAVPCSRCHASMRRAGPLPSFAGVDDARALLSYRTAARELVARIKYRNQRAAIDWLARGMAALVSQPFDVVTWAPANAAHVKERGFDHGELLARAVAKRLDAPAKELLTRPPDIAMTGRAAAARHVELRAACPVSGAVLLVDDVVTTGATSTAAARALKAAGANRVIVLAAAYTPPPGTHS